MTDSELAGAISRATAVGPHVLLVHTPPGGMFFNFAISEAVRERGVEAIVVNGDVTIDALPVPTVLELVADLMAARKRASAQDAVATLREKYIFVKRGT